MRLPPRALLLCLVFVAPLVAGCLGDAAEPPLPPHVDGPAADPASPEEGPVLVTADGIHPLDPWLVGADPPRDPPNALRLVQVDHLQTEHGALRWLTDGESFILLIDHSLDAYDEGTVVLARIHDTGGSFEVGRGAWVIGTEGGWQEPGKVPLVVAPSEPIRFGNQYAFEVLVFSPEEDAPFEVVADGPFGAFDAPRGHVVATAPGAPAEWNATRLVHWIGPFDLRAQWDLGFDGRTEGTDRLDPVERPLFGETDTGTYEVTLNGTRIWFAEVLLQFDRSRIAGTAPHAGGNGSSALHFVVDGYRPLPYYFAMAPDKGLMQSFKMHVLVDYETEDDLQQPDRQEFYYTTKIAYRYGPSSYVAGSDGRVITVDVTGRGV